MAADVDAAGSSDTHHQPASIFSLSSTPVGGVAQITVTQAQKDRVVEGSRVISPNRADSGARATIGSDPTAEISTGHQTTGGGMSENNAWSAFLRSPHFTVISTGVVAIIAGAGMFVTLDGRISALRLETKSDLQIMTQRTDSQFDKVNYRFEKLDSKFDKIDSRFDTIISKIDLQSKEAREMFNETKRHN